jgi:TrmH family RNA methyltransferase
MTTLTSPSNPKLKLIRALRTQRKQRDETGLCVVEGIRHVGEALQAGAQVAYLCYAPERLESEFGRRLVAEQASRGLPCYAVAAEVFESLADKDNPQGLLAVVHQPRRSLQELDGGSFPWGVALVAPQDPGNIGTILRTVDAVGASGVLLLDDSADAYAPAAVRASMGSLFSHPVVRARFDEFAAWAQMQGYHIYGTSAHGSLDYRQVQAYSRPCILLLGSERQGLSAEQAAVCEGMLRLPMLGRASSLNLAVAAGVLLYAMLP